MKTRIAILVVLFLSFFNGSVHAQSYYGGTFSVSSSWSLNGSGYPSFIVSPHVGWNIGPNMVVGLMPSLGFSLVPENGSSDLLLGATLYSRSAVLEFGQFGISIQDQMGLNFARSRDTVGRNVYTFSYGIGVVPVLTFRLDAFLTLVASLDCLSLSLSGNSVWIDGVSTNWSRTSSFGFPSRGSGVVSPLDNISLGFIYGF